MFFLKKKKVAKKEGLSKYAIEVIIIEKEKKKIKYVQ